MKRFTKTVLTVLAAVVLVFALVLAGCSGESASVKDILKTSSNADGDVYTIYYSDGTSSTITISNGSDVTAQQLYEYYKEVYKEDLTYDEFLKKYLAEPTDNASVIGACLQSAVKIYTEFVETKTSSSGGIFGGVTMTTQTAVYTGSGVVYQMQDDYTYIITNYHVVYDASASAANGGYMARKIVCYLYGSEGSPASAGVGSDGYAAYDYGSYAIECEYVGGSISNDIAIVRAKTDDILAKNPNVTTATFANEYHVGETAIAIGNPEGEGISVTEGIVSVDNEYINLQIDKTVRSYRSLRIDTAIYGGSSGGGLFNLKGELIGITNAGNTTDQNINYAIPLEIAKGTADNILHYYFGSGDNVGYGIKLGVQVVSQNSKYVYDKTSGYGTIREEIVVDSVNSGSIADSMGLEMNDILQTIKIQSKSGETSEVTLDRNFDISDVILTIRAGDTISFGIVRGGETKVSAEYTVKESDLVELGSLYDSNRG